MNDIKIRSIKFNNFELKYSLKRSSRKTIGIKIDKFGQVTVSSPLRTSENYIQQLLQKKADWIYKKILQIKVNEQQAQAVLRFVDGESITYMGKKYKIHMVQSSLLKKPDFKIEDERFYIRYSEFDLEKLRGTLKVWYVDRFKEYTEKSIDYYAGMIGARPQRVTIRDQKTRWGSCSAKGNINLNWRLILSPPEIIDYVIVHELCHMRQMNHSAHFWKLVEGIMPSYKVCRKWLKDHGDTLRVD